MTLSRDKFIAGLGLIVIVVLVMYGFTLPQKSKANQYDGLVTEKVIEMDAATRTYFEQRIATTQAAIAAHEAAGEEIDLDMYLSVASDAYSVGNLVLAREMLEKQLQGNPVNHVAWNSYAHVLEDMEDYTNAKNAYKEAMELQGGFSKYWQDYIDFLAEHDPEQTEEIKSWYEASVDALGQDIWNMVGLANLYAAQGDCDRAEDHYQVAITLEPDNQALKDDFNTLKRTCHQAP